MANVEILQNGNLKISIDQEEREEYKTRLEENGGYDATMLSDILEPYSCNDSFAETCSEKYGGLTDSPIIVSQKEIDENGKPLFYGGAWWLPDYQVRNELQELVENGFVIFEKIPE